MWMILITNPLGTSKKIHKVFAVYWTLENFPVKSRSALHCTQLALLCNSNDVCQFGCKEMLSPLLNDLKTLEEVGVYIETLGECLKGTVYSVVADNLLPMDLLVSMRVSGLHISVGFVMPPKQKCKQKMLLQGIM